MVLYSLLKVERKIIQTAIVGYKQKIFYRLRSTNWTYQNTGIWNYNGIDVDDYKDFKL